jgi:hypothetical protein
MLTNANLTRALSVSPPVVRKAAAMAVSLTAHSARGIHAQTERFDKRSCVSEKP